MGCQEDLTHHTPLIQACSGDSGGPVVVPTATGPVQIGVTSWGAETMDGECGEKFLPDVYMRTAAFTDFITQKKPVIEPFLKRNRPADGGFGASGAKVVGVARVGETITCKAAKLGGDPYKVSYTWQATTAKGFENLRGANKRTLEITRSIYRALPKEARRVGCTATARNKGGSLSMFSGTKPVHNA
jgi:hypothetical protein